MVSIFLATLALISASLGSLAGAISISNIYAMKYKAKMMQNIYGQALINFENDLKLTQDEAKNIVLFNKR
jgi:uncharacterized protein YbcI